MVGHGLGRFRHRIDGAGHRTLAVHDRGRAAQQLDALEVERVLRPHHHGARAEPEAIPQDGDLAGGEAAYGERRRRRRMFPRHHARHARDGVADLLVAACLHHRAVEHVDRRRNLRRRQPEAAGARGDALEAERAHHPAAHHHRFGDGEGERQPHIERGGAGRGDDHLRPHGLEAVTGDDHGVRSGSHARQREAAVAVGRRGGGRALDRHARIRDGAPGVAVDDAPGEGRARALCSEGRRIVRAEDEGEGDGSEHDAETPWTFAAACRTRIVPRVDREVVPHSNRWTCASDEAPAENDGRLGRATVRPLRRAAGVCRRRDATATRRAPARGGSATTHRAAAAR